MKTLSIRYLWGYFIALGIKDVENRKTLKNLKGYYLIQIPANIDWETDSKAPRDIMSEAQYDYFIRNITSKHLNPNNGTLKTSCIIGAMYIVGCVRHDPSKWAEEGVNNLVLDTEKAILFDEPIENIKGHLAPFDFELPEEYLKKYPQLREVVN